MQMIERAPRLAGLQALRGLAALYVFLFHLVPVSGLGGAFPILKNIARWGFSGVDLFFVLSGFVMWHTTQDHIGLAAARHFLLKRFARIYLGYWPMLVVAVVMFLLLSPQALHGADLIGSLLLIEADDRKLLITVAWSLCYEIYFYALFAVLLLIERVRRLWLIGLALLTVLVFNYSMLIHWQERLDGGTTEGYFFLSPFVCEFSAGALLAATYRARFFGFGRSWVSVVGIGLFILGAWVGMASGEVPAHQVQRLGSFGLAASGLILAVLALDAYVSWPRWTVALGDQSYALYLGHPLLLSFVALTGWFPVGASITQQLSLAGVAILLTIMLTAGYYRHVERPLCRWAYQSIDRRSVVARNS